MDGLIDLLERLASLLNNIDRLLDQRALVIALY